MAPADGIRSLDELTLAHQRVLVRVDFDVPLSDTGEVADDYKLRLALPTLRKALAEGARVIVVSELGEAGAAPVSMEPVAAKLAELLGQEVFLPDECVGDAARKVVTDLREGQLCLLENLRFAPEDERNEESFARRLAALADVYVNEAFAACQRVSASLVALPRLLNERGAGYRLKAELAALSRAAVTTQKPFVGILGGRSLLQKAEMLEVMLRRCDTICVGGVPANTLLAAREVDLKGSVFEREQLAFARALLTRARDQKVELLLPTDVVVGSARDDAAGRGVSVGSVPDGNAVFDIGPKTVETFASRVQGAKTVLWHGPLGATEHAAFALGTSALLGALAEAPAFGVVTGGSLAAVAQKGGTELEGRLGFVSTGGMASLAIIEGKKLPGVEALR